MKTKDIILRKSQLYFSKDGAGNIIQLKGIAKTHTKGVYQFGGISRNVKDLALTERAAMNINY